MPNAVLLTRDAEVVRVVRRVLETLATPLEIASTAEQAVDLINGRKYDAVLVDVDDVPKGNSVLSGLRTGKSNNKAIAFAVINTTTTVKAAYDLGANFVLSKPLTVERVTRSVRAGYGLILRERRRYQRHKVSSTGQLITSKGPVSTQILDVSEGGASLHFATPITADGQSMVTLNFQLPGMAKAVEAKGELLWTAEEGRAGFRIIAMAPEPRRIFDDWLSQQGSSGEEVFAAMPPAR